MIKLMYVELLKRWRVTVRNPGFKSISISFREKKAAEAFIVKARKIVDPAIRKMEKGGYPEQKMVSLTLEKLKKHYRGEK